jgi:DNA-binding MarR family transcriptional regulator
MARTPQDAVDRIVSQWQLVRPDIDASPIEVIGRISRLSRLVDRRLAENFAAFGIEAWMYDVLATLRRSGSPYELYAGELVQQSMVTTGAITNRIDRLEERGLVERASVEDRRKVLVRLTKRGVTLVDEVVASHMAVENEMLAHLSGRQRKELAAVLRTTLLALDDVATGN